MRLSHTALRRAYLKFNVLYFDGKLPVEVDVMFAPLDCRHARCDFTDKEDITITIDTMYALCSTLWKMSLLHEMAHIATGDFTHSRKFYNELDRLYAAGAYKGLL